MYLVRISSVLSAFLFFFAAPAFVLSATEARPYDEYELPAEVSTKLDLKASQMFTSKDCAGAVVWIQCGPRIEGCAQIAAVAKHALRPIANKVGFSVPTLKSYPNDMRMWENGGKRGREPRPPVATGVFSSTARSKCALEIADLVSIIAPSIVDQQIIPALKYYTRDHLPQAIVPLKTGRDERLDRDIVLYWRDEGSNPIR